jgi:hypothetical protein
MPNTHAMSELIKTGDIEESDLEGSSEKIKAIYELMRSREAADQAAREAADKKIKIDHHDNPHDPGDEHAHNDRTQRFFSNKRHDQEKQESSSAPRSKL